MKKIGYIVIYLIIVFLSLHIGTTTLSWGNIIRGQGNDAFLLVSARIPRTITVLLSGAGLSLSGLVMQNLTQNRFAAPDTIGTVESAKLGMLIGMIAFPGITTSWRMLVTFLFASGGSLLFLYVSSHFPFKSQMLIPLLGIMFGNIIGGFSSFLAFRYDVLQNISAWLQGNFSLVIEGQYELIYLSLFLIVGLYFFADYITIARFGKDAAQSLGLPFEAVQVVGTLLVAITVSVILVTAGNLPFLGVIIPNLIAMRFGDNIRNTHQKVALFGGFFLLSCDLISRTLIAPYEIPVELILGIVAGLIFLRILFKEVKAA